MADVTTRGDQVHELANQMVDALERSDVALYMRLRAQSDDILREQIGATRAAAVQSLTRRSETA